MRLSLVLCLIAAVAGLSVLPSYAAAPKKVSEVVSVDDALALADEEIAELAELVATEEKFAAAQTDHSLAQSAGLLACLAQAVTEHDGAAQAKVAPANLRDSALALRDAKSHADAKAALAAVQQARAGKAEGDAAKDHPWNKLINLHRLMEEVNARNSSLRRSARRIRKPQEDSLDAAALAVLALAIHADTHEVKDPALKPDWEKFALEYQAAMSELTGQMKKGDADAAYATWRNAQRTCQACHEKFKVEE